jgi:hypothetical protein
MTLCRSLLAVSLAALLVSPAQARSRTARPQITRAPATRKPLRPAFMKGRRVLRASDPVRLRGAKSTVRSGDYQALLEAFAQKLVNEGHVTRNGLVADRLDRASLRRAASGAARSHTLLAHRVTALTPAVLAQLPTITTPNVSRPVLRAGTVLKDVTERWSDRWGDTRYLALDLSAEAKYRLETGKARFDTKFEARGHVLSRSARLAKASAFAEAKGERVSYGAEVRVVNQVLYDYEDSFPTAWSGRISRRWQRSQTLLNTTVTAVFIPVTLRVRAEGMLGLEYDVRASARIANLLAHGDIVGATLSSRSRTVGSRTVEGGFAVLSLVGSATLNLNLGDVVGVIPVAGGILNRIISALGLDYTVGRAGVEVSVDLIDVSLRGNARAGVHWTRARGFFSTGNLRINLVLKAISNAEVRVYASARLPVGISARWGWPPITIRTEWRTWSTRLWHQNNPLFQATVTIANISWDEDFNQRRAFYTGGLLRLSSR